MRNKLAAIFTIVFLAIIMGLALAIGLVPPID